MFAPRSEGTKLITFSGRCFRQRVTHVAEPGREQGDQHEDPERAEDDRDTAPQPRRLEFDRHPAAGAELLLFGVRCGSREGDRA